jgi:DNA-binding transcriptional ArsR family regulator
MNVFRATTTRPTASSSPDADSTPFPSRRKVTKLAVLNLLASLPELTAAQAAQRLHTSLEASGMSLLRLTKSRLVYRERENGVYIYTLTAGGHARLTYLVRRARGRPE